jgi:aminomethyltransferase
MCNDNGGVLDDLIVYRFSSEKFFLCVNAANVDKDYLHLNNISKPFDCEVLDVSDKYGLIAIQGPKSTEFLEETLQENFSEIPRMHFAQKSFFNHLSLVARTGYTGEDGFEIFLPIEIINEFANLISSSFSGKSNAWVGLAARDSLRLEAGFCLHGNEISENISPVEARLLWAVSFDKLDFIGKSKLKMQKDNLDFGHVLHYEAVNRRIPRQGDIIYFEGSIAGKVLSGGYSPLIKKPIGTAYVQKDYKSFKQKGCWNADLAGNMVPINFVSPVLKKRV